MEESNLDPKSEFIAKEIGQTYVVIRCLVRAVIQQPTFDIDRFLKDLHNEEQKLTNSESAKAVIKLIISEVEGYS